MIRKGLVRTSAPSRSVIHILMFLAGMLGFSVPLWPSSASAAQLTLVWDDASNNELGFKIERRLGSTGIFIQIATVPANVTSYVDLNLLPNTTYFYRVRAFDGIWDSAYSNVAGDVTSGTTGGGAGGGGVPNTSYSLAATTVDSRRLRLNWVDTSGNESGFRIERKKLGSSIFTHVATVGSNVKSYTDTGLASKATYIYRIRTIGGLAHSTYSIEASATTLSPLPSRPSSLTATPINSASLRLHWLDASDIETGYKIERRAARSSVFKQIATVKADVVTYVDTELAPKATYVYRVRAVGPSGHSPYSNQAGASTLPATPAAPDNLSAAALDSRSLRLSWVDTSDNETGFRIERKTGLLGGYVQIAIVAADVTTYVNSSLSANTTYFYRVRSFNAGGGSAYSNPAIALTLGGGGAAGGGGGAAGGGAGGGAASSGSTGAAGSGAAASTGGAASGAGAAGAGAAAGSGATGGGGSGAGAVALAGAAAASVGATLDDSSIAGAAESIVALSVAGEPQALSALLVDGQQVLLAWIDESDNEAGFTIERKTGESGPYEKIADVDANVSEYTDSGVALETTYYYRVLTKFASDDVTYSNEASVTTGSIVTNKELEDAVFVTAAEAAGDPGAAATASNNPQSLSAGLKDGQNVALTWELAPDNTTGFTIERKTGESGEYDQIAAVNADVTSFSDSDVALETTYFYRVGVLGTADYSNEATVTTGSIAAPDDSGEEVAAPGTSGPPPNPQPLNAALLDDERVELTWGGAADGAADLIFIIERAIDESVVYEEIAVVGSKVSSYTDDDVFPGSTYSYRVRARNSAGDSEYSNLASVTLAGIAEDMFDLDPMGSPPPSPQPLSASLVDPQKAALTWGGASESETDLIFIIERATGSGVEYEEIAAVRGNVSSLIDGDLAPATTYFYRVRASGAFGDSEYSNEASVTTGNVPIENNTDPHTGAGSGGASDGNEAPVGGDAGAGGGGGAGPAEPPPPVATVPADPIALKAVALAGQRVSLSWTDVSNNETGFTIERGTGLGNYYPIHVVGPDVASYADLGLLAGTTYFYRVRANGSVGDSGYSNETSATINNPSIPDNSGSGGAGADSALPPGTTVGVPNKPEALGAMLLSAWQVALIWTDVSNNEIGFTIERATALSSYNQIAVVGANVCAFTDNGLLPGITYFYRVRANGSSGNSDYSNETSATTGNLATQNNSGAGVGSGSDSVVTPAPIVSVPNSPPPPVSGSASFVALDGATRGTWNGTHGSEGYYLMSGAANLPPYVQIHTAGNSDLVWAASSSELRALQQPGTSDRLAACWSSAASFLMDLDLTDGQAHRVAFYCVDWDGVGRVQTIEMLDPATDAPLNSQTLSTFSEGAYLVWNLQGRVRIRFTRVAGPSTVLSGIFFDSNGVSLTTGAGQVTSGAGIVHPVQGLDPAADFNAAPPPADEPAAEAGSNSGVQASSNAEPEVLTAQDFGSYALARIDGRPGQRFLVQIPDADMAWKGLQIVTITNIGYAFVILDSHGPDSTFYRALALD